MVKVKICGITNKDDAITAVELGADAVGFVFADSPRRVSPEEAAKICDGLPLFVARVGVFVDEEAMVVRDIAARCDLDFLQFHGSETPEFCRLFGRRAIKAFRVKDAASLNGIKKYGDNPFVLDTFVEEQAGGTGKTFDWKLARRMAGRSRIMLSGGMNPYAVDVSSGVEAKPGRKDKHKISEFIRAVRLSEALA